VIKAAAIKKGNYIYTGLNHKDIIQSQPFGALKGGEQGFITIYDNFVDRVEAAKIVKECGQVKELGWGPRLYSEDFLDENGNYTYPED
jgi:hypothetical protein